MRKFLFLFLPFVLSITTYAQDKASLNFYGFVRGDVFYNSRKNAEGTDGIFYLYPLAPRLDANGKDLNKTANSNFATISTRVGLDVKGIRIGTAQTTAKVEADFAGTGDMTFLVRLRQAYVNFNWENGSSLLVGQTWHPLFSNLAPQVVNLSSGAPFHPFNRSPMLKYQFQKSDVTLTAAAIYQLMNKSFGPMGASSEYAKNGVLPEIFLGIDYQLSPTVRAGASYMFLSIKPRTESLLDEQIFKVNERVNSHTYDFHIAYETPLWYVAGKTMITSNMAHSNMLGGYGVKSVDALTGERKYTPSQHSTSWINLVYGKEWKFGVFGGFSKNLGTTDKLVSTTDIYGRGMDIDRLLSGSVQCGYNHPHWSLSFEYNLTSAWYGDVSLDHGKIGNTNSATNHRLAGVFIYKF